MELDIKYQKPFKKLTTVENNTNKQNYINDYKAIILVLFLVLVKFLSHYKLLIQAIGVSLLIYFSWIFCFFAKKYYVNKKTKYENKEHNVDNLVGKLYHDTFGNVYLNIGDKYFAMTIDRFDNIEFYEIDKLKMVELPNSQNLKYDKIVDTEVTSLKKKIFDDIGKNEDSDKEEDFQNYKQKIKYLKEDGQYCKEEKEEKINESDDDNNEYFEFSKKENDNSILLLDKGFDTFAIYDTFVQDNMNNIVESFVFNNTNSYRVSFHKKEKTVELNIIGNVIKTYKLFYNYNDDDKIVIIVNNIDKKNNY
jgi:hypothetical protein